MYEMGLIFFAQTIRDWQLMVIIGVIVSVDFVLLGVLPVYRGGRTEATLVVNKENPSDETGVSYKSEKKRHTCLRQE